MKTIILLLITQLFSYSIAQDYAKSYQSYEVWNGTVFVHHSLSKKDCIDITNHLDSMKIKLFNLFSDTVSYDVGVIVAYSFKINIWQRRNTKKFINSLKKKFDCKSIKLVISNNKQEHYKMTIGLRFLG